MDIRDKQTITPQLPIDITIRIKLTNRLALHLHLDQADVHQLTLVKNDEKNHLLKTHRQEENTEEDKKIYYEKSDLYMFINFY